MTNIIQKIGYGLKEELKKGSDVLRIAQWAYNVSNAIVRDLDKDTAVLLNSLALMELDPQFEFTEFELNELAELLINGKKNAIDIIRKKYNSQN